MRSLLLALTLLMPQVAAARTPVAETASDPPQKSELERKRIAVTLNYCRASLSRIRRYPSRRVLLEEQERILNNLNLNSIRDEEVVNLYSALLDEISQEQIADRERNVISEQTQRNMQRQIGSGLFVIGAQMATGQLGSAIQSGANSWWDYRNSVMDREVRTWAVERTRMNNIVSRSSRFLDAAWRLSQSNDIPDEWLVRNDDLIRLERTMRQPDLEVRLRVLKRMSRFMSCYPPYWYYVARTQQRLGQVRAAAATYRRLSELGHGHFRKDQMLAAGLANLAMIEEFLEDPAAPRTATKALERSTGAWEVNLTCAWVLSRHRDFGAAEDAILRNLDVELEEQQSSIALVSLYYHSGDRKKLAKALRKTEIAERVPVPGLLLCAGMLGDRDYPPAARQRLLASLRGIGHIGRGRSNFSLRSSADWKLADARISMSVGQSNFADPKLQKTKNGIEARFASGRSLNIDRTGTMIVTLKYPAAPTIRLHLEPAERNKEIRLSISDRQQAYRISAIDVGKQTLQFDAPAAERS